MPTDYTSTANVVKGAQMGAQKRELTLQERKDQREAMASDVALKISNARLKQIEADAKEWELNTANRNLMKEIQMEELQNKQKSMVRRNTLSENFDLPDPYDFLEPLAREMISMGQPQSIPNLINAFTPKESKTTIKGFDSAGKPVLEKDGNLIYGNGTPYSGGPLAPITKASTIGLSDEDYEFIKEEIKAGRQSLDDAAKGSRGAEIRAKLAGMLAREGIDIRSLEANRKSKESALRALEKTTNQLKPFEETARKNLMYAQDLSHQYVRSKFPAFNKLKALWDTQTGDPLIEKFKTATYTGILEAMKHNTAGSGISASELSVRAQEKADQILNTAKSWEQFDSIVDALDVDMTNRAESYAEQVIKLKQTPLNEYMTTTSGKKGKLTDPVIVQEYLTKAGGNINKAKAMAKKDGWEFD